jgi:stearoyl-CoA desaturase (delta-9 desaturase)
MESTLMAQQLPWALLFFAAGGWPWLVWGVCVRVTAGTTGYWLVNYAAHRWGYRAYENRGAAVQGWNVWLLGALSMGEGWHNNHHAFPRSARLGMRWWELDLGWCLLAALRAVGLARDVRLADAASRAATAADLAG